MVMISYPPIPLVSQFNVLWLNSNNPDSFPDGLTEALAMRGHSRVFHEKQGESIQVRLRRQIQADALEPLDGLERPPATTTPLETFSSEQVEEVIQFLRLQVRLCCSRDDYLSSNRSPGTRSAAPCSFIPT